MSNNLPSGPEDSEFAEKLPLIDKKKLKHWFVFALVLFGLITIVTFGAVFVKNLLTQKPASEPPKPPEVQVKEPEKEKSIPVFAYIKNGKSIWKANIQGDDKKRLVETPISTDAIFTSIKWKEKNKLGYSKCEPGNCAIAVYDLTTKSITPEVDTEVDDILDVAWSKNLKYLAYIEVVGGKTNLRLKFGTVDKILNSFLTAEDKTRSKSSILFTNDNQFVIYATLRKDRTKTDKRGKEYKETVYPITYIYQVNGAQIDEIKNASDPMLIDDLVLGYKNGASLYYTTIGKKGESIITQHIGYNPKASPDKKSFAYWENEKYSNIVILGIFETGENIHRNILRGIIAPIWLSNDIVAGIQTDSCFGDQCLLYEFKTATLVIVNINTGDVTPVDQGKSISNIVYENNAN